MDYTVIPKLGFGLMRLPMCGDSVDIEQTKKMEGVREVATFFREKIVPAMYALRRPIDHLELMVDKSLWPVPTYGDLMFEV